jgi:hypothetical protein
MAWKNCNPIVPLMIPCQRGSAGRSENELMTVAELVAINGAPAGRLLRLKGMIPRRHAGGFTARMLGRAAGRSG